MEILLLVLSINPVASPQLCITQIFYVVYFKLHCRGPVLKINNHGNHGRGTKGIWGDQRDGFASFGFPKIIVLSLKFYLWSLLSHCFVPQIPFMVPRIQLFCPLKFDPPKLLFCPHKFHS